MAIDREIFGRPCDHSRGIAPDGFARFSLEQQVPQSFQRGFVCSLHAKNFCPRKPLNTTQLIGATL